MLINFQQCPKCNNKRRVRHKLIIIGKYKKSTLAKLHPVEDRAGWCKNSELTVNECNSKQLKADVLSQFVDGYYCDLCDLGFVSNDLYQRDLSQAALEAYQEINRLD